MTPVAEGQDTYLAEHARFMRGRGEAAPAWLKTMREKARDAFQNAGFPTTRQEEWRFTNVSAIASTPFKLAEGTPTNHAPIVSRVAVPGAVRLVLLNGRFAPELSDLTTVPVGLKIGSLAAAIAQGAPECSALGQQPVDGLPFAALNTAFLEDGALISVRKGAVIDTPVHVIIITGGTGKTMVHPRVLLAAGAGSQSSLAISFLTAAGEAHLTNAVIEATLADQAIVDCCLDQRGTEGSFLVTNLHVNASRDSSFKVRTITLGGRIVRNDATAVLAGEGAHVDIDGCYLADGDEPGGQPHHDRSRDAELHQPRALQGHPGRQRQGGVQRPHHRPPRRAEDRLEADQPRAAAVGRRDHELEPAARDLRRRREVHARGGGRAAGRRGDVLPAGPRAEREGRARHADPRLRGRGARAHCHSAAAGAAGARAVPAARARPGRARPAARLR